MRASSIQSSPAPADSATAPRPTHRVRLRDGRTLDALAIEAQPGWLRAEIICYRHEIDEQQQVGYRLADRVERRLIPAARVRDVREVAA